jgi:nitrous oxidase accessory protein NosD
VSANKVSSSTFDGITLDTVTQTLLQSNDSSNNNEGIGVYASTGAKIDNNDTDDNDTDGLFADTDTSGNSFTNNEASGNGNLDCEDVSTGTGTAGTANTWLKDVGDTSSPAGICQPPRGHKGGHGHGHGPHNPHYFWGWK